VKLWGSLGVAHSLVDEKSTKHNGSLQPSWKRTHGESMFVRRRLCRGAPESSAEAMWSHGVLSHLTADLWLPLQDEATARAPVVRATGAATASVGRSPDILDAEHQPMPEPLTRITRDPEVMGGKPCLRGLRVTVGTVVGLVATGRSTADILALYPYLEEADIREALEYAAWRVEEVEVPLRQPA